MTWGTSRGESQPQRWERRSQEGVALGPAKSNVERGPGTDSATIPSSKQ